MTKLTRRDFFKTASLMGGVSLFAGCSFFGDSSKTPEFIKGAPGVDPIESLLGIKNLFSVCALCEGKCGICCRTAEGSVVKIGGSPYHPISRQDPLPFEVPAEQAALIGASICAIGSSGIQTLYDPFRIARPLRRDGARGSGKWKAVSWSQAISEITNGGNLFGEGNVPGLKANVSSGDGFGLLLGEADWGSLNFIRAFLGAFPGARLFRDDSVLSRELVISTNESVFGKGLGNVFANYGKARFLLNFGSAPVDSGVPLVSTAREIADARAMAPSMKWAVIDPRQSTSATKADIWLPIIPGTDLNFALAIMKALLERFPGSVRFSNDAIKNAVKSHTVSEYADSAGSYEGAAVEIARNLAEAGPYSAVIPGAGVYGQKIGKQSAEAILALNLMVGSIPGAGGLSFNDDSFFSKTAKKVSGLDDSRFSDVRPLSPIGSLMIWGSDPVHSNKKVASLISNNRDFPLLVAISPTITETAAFADYIFPDTTYLERWDICSAPGLTSNTGFGLRAPVVGGLDKHSGRYFPILPETMLMEDILFRLSEELGLGFGKDLAIKDSPSIARGFYHRAATQLADTFNENTGGSVGRSASAEQMFERGGYFRQAGIAVRTDKIQNSFNVDVSKWEQPLNLNVNTKTELLTLITYSLPFHRSGVASVNSWLLETLPENRLIINPIDASRRGLKQGESVVIESGDGSIKSAIRIQIAPGIRPGVVALANGFGQKGSGATPYSIDKSNSYFDKPRSAGVNPADFIEKGQLIRIHKS